MAPFFEPLLLLFLPCAFSDKKTTIIQRRALERFKGKENKKREYETETKTI